MSLHAGLQWNQWTLGERFSRTSEGLTHSLPHREDHLMLSSMAHNWWLVVINGIFGVIIGVAAFVWPGVTFQALVLLFGAFAFVDGVLGLAFGLWAASSDMEWWPLVLGGILGVVVGVLAVTRPTEVALALVFVLGTWAMLTGLLEIVAAIRLRKLISSEWLLGLGGVLSILFGVVVLAQPAAGALFVVYLFAVYAILGGLSQIGLGMRLRGFQDARAGQPQPAPSAL
jgi:uncharacterized membrane protein HdeD (DUF308 family)